MEEKYLWLAKMIFAHLLTDFILQPGSWIKARNTRHFSAPELYYHGLATAIVALLLVGPRFWASILIIGITHTIIDGWKSYQKQTSTIFLLDQALHIAVIFTCWILAFFQMDTWSETLNAIGQNTRFWVIAAALLFLTTPTGILIGQFTKKWRNGIHNSESLANAGKWIGIIERIIIFLLVLMGEFGAIGLLIAAKSLLRFGEKRAFDKSNPSESKTEYLLIGSLLSLGIALLTGILTQILLH